MAEPKSPVYIGIPEHVDIRRDLLLSSKDLLGALKAYETIKETRAKRAELTFELHKIMDELGVLTKKTRMSLPKPPARIAGSVRDSAPSDDDKPSRKGKSGNVDKLSALDSELSRIEAKLSRL